MNNGYYTIGAGRFMRLPAYIYAIILNFRTGNLVHVYDAETGEILFTRKERGE